MPPSVDSERLAAVTAGELDMAFRRRMRTVLEWIDPADGQLILDMPCGRGFYLRAIRALSACTLVGADIDTDALARARGNTMDLENIALVRADALALPFPDRHFDGLILSEGLEHMDDDRAALGEAIRVLKPGGIAAITVPSSHYPFCWDPVNRTLETLFGTAVRRGPLAGIWTDHQRLYDAGTLRERVATAGFEIEEERATTHRCLPFSHNLLYGIGKPLVDRGLVPAAFAASIARGGSGNDGGQPSPAARALGSVLAYFDRGNGSAEPPGVSTVNLCVKARKPRH